jgi:hypothetical protein
MSHDEWIFTCESSVKYMKHNKNKIAFFGVPLSNKALITLQSM